MSQARQAFNARTCSLARRLVGWSASELAGRAGLTPRTIIDLESGTRSPRHGTVSACLRAFKNTGVVFIMTDSGADCVLDKDDISQISRARGNGDAGVSLK
jgi:transcriptional regulator with XRE-family HTH domain